MSDSEIAHSPNPDRSVPNRAKIIPVLPRSARLIAAAPALLEALKLILAEPHGCPMCDSGTLRNPDKQHWESCGFARAVAVVAQAEGRS